MHSLFLFVILDDSVMVFTLDALKSLLAISKVAEYVLDFFLSEIVGSCFVSSNIEIIFQFGDLLRGESELSQVVPTVVTEVEDSTRGQLVVDLLSDALVIRRLNGREDKDELPKRCRERRERYLFVHQITRLCINVLLLPELVFFDEVDGSLSKVTALDLQRRHAESRDKRPERIPYSTAKIQ